MIWPGRRAQRVERLRAPVVVVVEQRKTVPGRAEIARTAVGPSNAVESPNAPIGRTGDGAPGAGPTDLSEVGDVQSRAGDLDPSRVVELPKAGAVEVPKDLAWWTLAGIELLHAIVAPDPRRQTFSSDDRSRLRSE